MFWRIAVTFLLGCFLATHVEAYGKRGHALVGAIADQRLASKPIANKISDLLDGLSLADAALLPDEIKAWDHIPDPGADRNTFHLPNHPIIEKDLLEFLKANPVGDKTRPSHHNFHFTDVPLFKGVTYKSGKIGRSDSDVVSMIPYCVKVLQGKEPEDNDRKITKRIAVILLAHFVGDIHQPLHVGAMYFNADKQTINPNGKTKFFGTMGSGKLTLILQRPDNHGARARFNMHTYWDDDSVDFACAAVGKEMRARRSAGANGIPITDTQIAKRLAADEPKGWKLDLAGIELSTAWADEILPMAQAAHDRLDIKITTTKGAFATGHAEERVADGESSSYDGFAGSTVRTAIQKAGWRLADLLESAAK